MVDLYIEKAGATAPPADPRVVLSDALSAPELLSLDLRRAGISTIIWAAGYRFDFGLVKFPVFEESGFPITRNCETSVPGLYLPACPGWIR